MNIQSKFILTTSKETAEKLISSGYVPVNISDGKWTFVNDNKMTFSNKDNVIYTNKLFI